MTEAPGTNFEFNEADRLEQSIDAEQPETDDQDVEAPAHRDRSAASSLEANPADLEEQDQEVVLDDHEEGSTLEEQ